MKTLVGTLLADLDSLPALRSLSTDNIKTRLITSATLTSHVKDGQYLTIRNFTQDRSATQRGAVIAGVFPTPAPTPTPTPTPTPYAQRQPCSTVRPTPTPIPNSNAHTNSNTNATADRQSLRTVTYGCDHRRFARRIHQTDHHRGTSRVDHRSSSRRDAFNQLTGKRCNQVSRRQPRRQLHSQRRTPRFDIV